MRVLLGMVAIVALQSDLPPRVTPRVVADLAGYSEGIVFSAAGAAFVSTLHREAVYIISGREAPRVWYRVTEPNGHRFP